MIEITDLDHSIGATQILAPSTLQIPKGKLSALIGPNGAGKSTLAKLVARIDTPAPGRIRVNGLDVASTPGTRLARELSYLGQQTHLASRLRVRELVGYGRWPHSKGRPGAADRAAVADALSRFDLDALADRFLDTLSGGQSQRAHLAMTVAQETPGSSWTSRSTILTLPMRAR